MLLDKATILKKMLEADLIDRKQVSEAVSRCKGKNGDLYEFLVSQLCKSSEKINRFFLENFDYHPIILNDIVLNPNVVNMVPTDLMVNHLIIPAFQVRQIVYLAVSDPLDIDGLNAVMKYTGEKCSILLSTKDQILKAISEYVFKPKIAMTLK
jgi:type IV pilus assembly protein PilB